MKTTFNKLHEMTLRSLFNNMFGNPDVLDAEQFPSPLSVLNWAAAEGYLKLPPGVEAETAFILPERIPLLVDLRATHRSILVRALLERPEETALVADSVTPGRAALNLSGLYTDAGTLQGWIERMNPAAIELITKPVDETYGVVVAPLLAFVTAQ